MTTLCDFDRSLIDQAWELAKARMPELVKPEQCDLCEPERHCPVHRTPNEWGKQP